MLLSGVTNKYQHDKQVVGAALSQNGLALQFVNKTLLRDVSVVKCALN